MTKVFTDVSVFMNAVDQTVGEENIPQSSLYHNLIVEEYNEFIAARNAKDDVEIIDACFDMMWVIVGYMQSRGWDCENIWDEGAMSNLAKIDKQTGKVIKRADGKVLKPEGWQPPNFAKFVKANK
jgi:predicted HAD superfamily Cof-like phosphohydrolase